MSFAAEKPDNYILVSIPVTFTIVLGLVGLIYLCRKVCVPEIREKCCWCCCSVSMEKEDENPEYGEYRQAWSSHYLILLLVYSDMILLTIVLSHIKHTQIVKCCLRWVLRSRWPKETWCDGGNFRFPSLINCSMSIHWQASIESVAVWYVGPTGY